MVSKRNSLREVSPYAGYFSKVAYFIFMFFFILFGRLHKKTRMYAVTYWGCTE